MAITLLPHETTETSPMGTQTSILPAQTDTALHPLINLLTAILTTRQLLLDPKLAAVVYVLEMAASIQVGLLVLVDHCLPKMLLLEEAQTVLL